MNKEILRAMSRKKRLWRKLRRGDNCTEYNEAEKKLRKLIRNAKRNFEKKLAKDKGNSRPFYAYLKQKRKQLLVQQWDPYRTKTTAW